RRRQSVHRRRQRPGDWRRGQSDADDPGGGAAHRRSHSQRPRRPEVGMTAARSLTDAERTVLRAVMDRLVPPIDDLPGAGTMGLLDQVEAMARAHPPFHLALLALLGGLPAATFATRGNADQDEAITRFEAAHPAVFNAALEVVYLA